MLQASYLKKQNTPEEVDAKPQYTLLGDTWNDMRWHIVRLTPHNDELNVSIDGNFDDVIVIGDSYKLKEECTVYAGGYGFMGCITNVSYPIGQFLIHFSSWNNFLGTSRVKMLEN